MIGKYMQQASTRDYSQWWAQKGTFPWMFQQAKPPIEPRVISVRENYERCVRGQQPYWMPAYGFESNIIYGANGRIMASVQAGRANPLQGQIAREELYQYSLEYYNKLYGRG